MSIKVQKFVILQYFALNLQYLWFVYLRQFIMSITFSKQLIRCRRLPIGLGSLTTRNERKKIDFTAVSGPNYYSKIRGLPSITIHNISILNRASGHQENKQKAFLKEGKFFDDMITRRARALLQTEFYFPDSFLEKDEKRGIFTGTTDVSQEPYIEILQLQSGSERERERKFIGCENIYMSREQV